MQPNHPDIVMDSPFSSIPEEHSWFSINRLPAIIGDPYLGTLLRRFLYVPALQIEARDPSNFYPTLKDGYIQHFIRDDVMHTLWFSLRRLARYIIHSGNNLDPHNTPPNYPIPRSVPREALVDVRMRLPSILLIIRHDTPPSYPFGTTEEAIEYIALVQHCTNYTVSWILEAIKRSLAIGLPCQWNWGAHFSLSWESFIQAAARHPLFLSHTWQRSPALVLEYDPECVDDMLTLIITPESHQIAHTLNLLIPGRDGTTLQRMRNGAIVLGATGYAPLPFNTFYGFDPAHPSEESREGTPYDQEMDEDDSEVELLLRYGGTIIRL